MRSRILLSIPLLLAGVGLTACSSSSTASLPPDGGATATSAAVTHPPVGPTVSGSTAPASTPPADPATPSTGSRSAQAQATNCRTKDLKWTFIHLSGPDPSLSAEANGELIAVNTGSHSCTLAGFPRLELHMSKGPQEHGVGKGSFPAVTLGPGKKAVIALEYSEMHGKGPGSDDGLVTASSVDAAAPGDSTTAGVTVVDQSGKPTQITTIDGAEIHMSPPAVR